MRNVKVAAVQMTCNNGYENNLTKAKDMIIEAINNGANVILLPELFEREYFCQERRYEYYSYAQSANDNVAIKMALELSLKYNVVIPVSFYEKDNNNLYNSIACVDNGKILGIYRKTHIPDDHFYQEKFYFTPSNTGFKVFDTSFGKIGIGICWDQWYPETARCLVLDGAELLLYPTAIGSEPILEVESYNHWRRVMQGHAAANIVPVVAANRIGSERVIPCKENNYQDSKLVFYGKTFMCDETGDIIESLDDEEAIIYHTYNLDDINEKRLSWGLFRDRQPNAYHKIID